jgi:hypothetical protein
VTKAESVIESVVAAMTARANVDLNDPVTIESVVWTLQGQRHRARPTTGTRVGRLVWIPADGGGIIPRGAKGLEYTTPRDARHIAVESSVWTVALSADTRDAAEALHHLLVYAVVASNAGALRHTVAFGPWAWLTEDADRASLQSLGAARAQQLTIAVPITEDLTWRAPLSAEIDVTVEEDT